MFVKTFHVSPARYDGLDGQILGEKFFGRGGGEAWFYVFTGYACCQNHITLLGTWGFYFSSEVKIVYITSLKKPFNEQDDIIYILMPKLAYCFMHNDNNN